jgi:recombination protein U
MDDIRYPDGRPMPKKGFEKPGIDHRKSANKSENEKAREHLLKANMGLSFEADISKTCDFYRTQGSADIYKRPTPIKVVHMSKTHPGQIDEAYFQEKSTTDYVGIYQGRYLDFECKETIHDEIPFAMIREQQLSHLKLITALGGLGFFLFSFRTAQEVYLIKAIVILTEIEKRHHPGFPRDFVKEHGILVERSYNPPYHLLPAIDEAFDLR